MVHQRLQVLRDQMVLQELQDLVDLQQVLAQAVHQHHQDLQVLTVLQELQDLVVRLLHQVHPLHQDLMVPLVNQDQAVLRLLQVRLEVMDLQVQAG